MPLLPKRILSSSPFKIILRVQNRHQSDLSTVNGLGQDEVITESINEIGIITLNRPKVLNVLSFSMIENISKILLEWQNSKKIIIIKGQGKGFCAGGDVRSIAASVSSGDNQYPESIRGEYTLPWIISRLKIPYIALMHGVTMGGGVGISVHGSYRVVTENTVVAMPETAIGFLPDVGTSHILPRLPHKMGGQQLGLFLGLTGHRLKGSDLLRVGIGTHMCPSQLLPNFTDDLISMQNPSKSTIEQILQSYTDASPDSKKMFSLEGKVSQIKKIFGGNSVEEIVQNLEKEGSDWSKNIGEILKRMSPTSLKITHELFNLGSQMNLRNCLEMEYRVALRCCETTDLLEGVRALLVDKDQKPQWNPPNLEGVSASYVNKYFEPLDPNKELNLTNTIIDNSEDYDSLEPKISFK